MQSMNLHRVHSSGDKTIRCKLFLMEADVKTQTDSQPLHMACKKTLLNLCHSRRITNIHLICSLVLLIDMRKYIRAIVATYFIESVSFDQSLSVCA